MAAKASNASPPNITIDATSPAGYFPASSTEEPVDVELAAVGLLAFPSRAGVFHDEPLHRASRSKIHLQEPGTPFRAPAVGFGRQPWISKRQPSGHEAKGDREEQQGQQIEH
jgi:hypothetical protein